ncbi:MAG: hypothetical protein K6E38_06500, partial [Fretibacterium sp.]|nr:hypothetical protein [Fretibacterium sp.]
LCPASPKEVYAATYAAYHHKGPVYLRLGTNREPEIYEGEYKFEVGEGVELKSGGDAAIFSTGSILKDVLDAADSLEKEGISARVINIHTLKPLDGDIILKAIHETGHIVTVEDHNITGGLGSAVAEVIAESGMGVKFRRVGLRDFSHGYGTYAQVKEGNGVGRKQIEEVVREVASR